MILKLHGAEVQIDDEMALLVKELNRLGLKTIGCCEGHGKKGRTYLSFDASDVTVLLHENKVNVSWTRSTERQ